MTNRILVIITILLVVGCNSKNKIDFQNFEIFPTNGKYIVRGAIDLEKHFQSDEANEAIQWAADQFDDGGQIFIHKGDYVFKK